jgi:hypothetical protein
MIAVPSAEADATCTPSSEKSTADTAAVCPMSVALRDAFLASTFHSFTLPSFEPEASSRSGSGEYATA